MLRSKGRILYDSCEGVPGNPAEGTRLRSSGRSCGACQAAPRDYQAQSQLTSSAEPRCEARPPCGRRRTSRGGRSTTGGGVADPEPFSRRAAERPGVPFVMAFPDRGWFPPAALGGRFRLPVGREGRREGRGPHPPDGALCSDPRAASSTILRRGAWKPSPKGLGSGRAAGRAVPVSRPHGTTRRSPNTLPRRSRIAKRGRGAGGAGRSGAAAHARPRTIDEAAWRDPQAAPASGGGPVHEGRYAAGGVFHKTAPRPATSTTGSRPPGAPRWSRSQDHCSGSTVCYASLQGPYPLRLARRGAWKPSPKGLDPGRAAG